LAGKHGQAKEGKEKEQLKNEVGNGVVLKSKKKGRTVTCGQSEV